MTSRKRLMPILLFMCAALSILEARIAPDSSILISRDPCVHFGCRNGGTCVAPADIPRCQCRPGFTGARCQTRDIADPIPDVCGPCPRGYTCQRLRRPVLCVRAPCPTFRCVPRLTLDRCGGCPPGRTCRTIWPMCAAPPPHCGNLLARLRRSAGCPGYVCEPVHVCM